MLTTKQIRETILDNVGGSDESECLRKTVHCSIVCPVEGYCSIYRSMNGPVGEHKCKNIVGGCGCLHAEPRAILNFMQSHEWKMGWSGIMVCDYSPCTNCASLIIESGCILTVLYETLTDHDPDGVSLLNSAGIACVNLDSVRHSTEEQLYDFLREQSVPVRNG